MKNNNTDKLRKFVYDCIDEMLWVSGVNNDKRIGCPNLGALPEKVWIEDKNLPEGCKKFTDHLIQLADGTYEDGESKFRFYCIENPIALELSDGKYSDNQKPSEYYYIDISENFLNVFTSKNGKGYFESVFFRCFDDVSNRTMLMIDIVNWMNEMVNR